MRFVIRSRVSDDVLREKMAALSDEEKSELINKLCVSKTMFQNWMEGKDKLVNAKTRNRLINLMGC